MIIFRLLSNSISHLSHWVAISNWTWNAVVINDSPVSSWLMQHSLCSCASSMALMKSAQVVPVSNSASYCSRTFSFTQSLSEIMRFCWTLLKIIFPSATSLRLYSRNVAINLSVNSSFRWCIPSGEINTLFIILILCAKMVMPRHVRMVVIGVAISFYLVLINFWVIG